MSPSSHHRQVRRRAVIAAVLATAAVGATAPGANAAYDFWNGAVGSGDVKESSFEALRATLGWADSPAHKAQVGAGGTGGLYGSFVDGFETACHGYAGTTPLKGLLRNPHSVTQNPYRGRVRVAPEIACGSFGDRVAGPDSVSSVSDEITSSFAIFRDQKASPVPEAVVKATITAEAFGANTELAREIKTTTGIGWVVPAADHLCVIQADPTDGYGVVCTSTSQVVKSGLYLGMRKDLKAGSASNTFLVPDGAQLEQTDLDGKRSLAVSAQRLAADNGVASQTVPYGTTLDVASR